MTTHRDGRLAQWLLALFTTPQRAASIVGDLVELPSPRARFWLAVFHIAGACLSASARSRLHPEVAMQEDARGMLERIWERRRLVLACTLMAAIGTAALVYTRQPTYRAQAILLFEPPLPGVSLAGNPDWPADEGVPSHPSLGDEQLHAIIRELDLYPDRPRSDEDSAVRLMRRDVTMSWQSSFRGGPPRILSVSFKGTEPHRVADVTDRLMRAAQSECSWLRVVDTPRPPSQPLQPNHALNAAGTGAGFAFGLMLAGLLPRRRATIAA